MKAGLNERSVLSGRCDLHFIEHVKLLLQTTQCLPHTASTASLHRLVAPHKNNIICVVKVKLSALFVQSVRLVFLTNVPKKSSLVFEERK
jgi:hypothetical protein